MLLLALCCTSALLTVQAWDHAHPPIDQVPATLVLGSVVQPDAPGATPPTAAPDLLKEIVDPGTPERIATGGKFNEGPVWIPGKDGKPGHLLYSDIPSDTIFRLDPPETGKAAVPQEFRKPSGHSNGLFLDDRGELVICEHEGRVSRLGPKGTLAVLAASWDGKSLNSPNDACVRSDGVIFFTDPPYGLNKQLGKERKRELDFCGVYRIDTSGKLHLLVKDLGTPNGIALSVDEKTLYVANHGKGEIWAYPLRGKPAEGELLEGKLIAQVQAGGRSAGADGLRLDTTGNLYVAARGGIHVFKPTGEVIGVIGLEESPTNLVFGDDDRKTIYATTGAGSIYRVRVKVAGAVK